jgi:hypothetical protein
MVDVTNDELVEAVEAIISAAADQPDVQGRRSLLLALYTVLCAPKAAAEDPNYQKVVKAMAKAYR